MTEEIAAVPVTFDGDKIVVGAPELAQELGKRIVGGLLKAVRSFVPTRENLEGKKEHCDVALKNGAIYVGTDHSVYAAVIRPKLADLCKKKSPLRSVIEQLGDGYSALLNYGTASPWLKIHEKNIRYAEMGPEGIRLVVADGLVELRMLPTAESSAYADEVAEIIETRVLEENLEIGPLPLDVSDIPAWATVLCVTPEAATFREYLTDAPGEVQMKFKPGVLPGSSCEVRVYADPEGGKVVRFTTDDATMHVEQYFRVLCLDD